jgi:hypothetical protein
MKRKLWCWVGIAVAVAIATGVFANSSLLYLRVAGWHLELEATGAFDRELMDAYAAQNGISTNRFMLDLMEPMFTRLQRLAYSASAGLLIVCVIGLGSSRAKAAHTPRE